MLLHRKALRPRAVRTWAVSPLLGGVELLSAAYDTHVFAPHAQDTLVLGLVESGRIAVRCEGRTLDVAPGDVLVIAPGVIHAAHSVASEPWRYRALYLSPAQWRWLAGAEVDPHALLVTGASVLRDAEVARLLARAHEELEATPDHLPGGEALLGRLGTAVRACTSALDDAGRELSLSARLDRVCVHLERHLDRRVSLDELARVAGMSRFALVRAFSDALGVSPYAYSLQRRLDAARRLLAAGTSISQAANQLGFADQSHLTRWFLRVVGVTPGEYLRALPR